MRKTIDKKIRISITVPISIKTKIEIKRETDSRFNVSEICTNALTEATRSVII